MNLLGGCKYKIYNIVILYLHPSSKFKINYITSYFPVCLVSLDVPCVVINMDVFLLCPNLGLIIGLTPLNMEPIFISTEITR